MLIGFIGCPASGKTTTAALVFAKLKHYNVVAEFIPEQARTYIAHKRVQANLAPIKLTDEDQLAIMTQQHNLEELFVKACGKHVVVVTDSCSINSLLYMTPSFRKEHGLKHPATQFKYDYLFYTAPLNHTTDNDPNRVHSYAESLEIDKSIPTIVNTIAPNTKLHRLIGTPEQRAHNVAMTIFDRLANADHS